MNKGNIVYSTNKNFRNQSDDQGSYLEKNEYILSVCYEKKGRSGKGVTIIKGYQGNPINLTSLSKELKSSLGIGGSIKKGEIILQGRIQEKVMNFLNSKNYKTKKVGG
ncbi:translation initiation factor [Flavobacteriales bacterium]|nr:translation initiation factor [Flavobacteriales bacterium]